MNIEGAVWKFSHSEQAVPALRALPHGVWLGMAGLEVLCCIGLVVPALSARLGFAAPLAAAVIAAEMLLFCGLFAVSGARTYGQVVYWLVVAVVCAFVVYGRFV